jgi:hypothetical protein
MSANVQLSAQEMALVTNAEWILTKNAIIEKVYRLLGDVSALQQAYLPQQACVPDGVLLTGPKISRGENYRGLPWVMLDYPRYFKKEDVFAIRSFFWWGNYFLVSLHLGGQFKTRWQQALAGQWQTLQREGWLVCMGDDPWQHYLGVGNFVPAADMGVLDWENQLAGKNFIKIGQLIPLGQWDAATGILFNFCEKMLSILAMA